MISLCFFLHCKISFFSPRGRRSFVRRMQHNVGPYDLLNVHRHRRIRILDDVVIHHDSADDGRVMNVRIDDRRYELVTAVAVLLDKIHNLRRGQMLERRAVADRCDAVEAAQRTAGDHRRGGTAASYGGIRQRYRVRAVTAAAVTSCEKEIVVKACCYYGLSYGRQTLTVSTDSCRYGNVLQLDSGGVHAFFVAVRGHHRDIAAVGGFARNHPVSQRRFVVVRIANFLDLLVVLGNVQDGLAALAPVPGTLPRRDTVANLLLRAEAITVENQERLIAVLRDELVVVTLLAVHVHEPAVADENVVGNLPFARLILCLALLARTAA